MNIFQHTLASNKGAWIPTQLLSLLGKGHVHYELGPLLNVMPHWVTFGVIVSPVEAASAPDEIKLALSLPAFEEVETHVI